MKPLSFLWALLMLLAMSPGAHAAQGAQPAAQRTYIGQDTCVGCHDTEGTSIHQTAHGKKQIPGSPESDKGCESCHGPGSAHLDDPSVPDSIRRFGQIKPREASATCLTCHTYRGAGTSNYGGTPGLANSSLSNPALKWESTQQVDVGVDLTLFKGRVFLTADWYKKNTQDLLLARPISNTSGFTTVFDNVGDMTNKGFEIGLETVNIQAKDPKGFNWRTGLNLSINRNEVTKLANNEPFSSYVNRVQVGHELGEFYMLKFLGVDPATGDAIFKDVDGDGVITSNDQTFVGSPHPDYSGGLTNEFTWKGVDLSFLMTFSQGNKIYNDMRTYSASGGYYFDNHFKDQLKRWQKPGDQTDVPRASYDGVSGAYGDPTSRFLENGSYLRMQEVTMGYQFPENWAAGVKARSLRLYAGVRNAFVITDYTGYDPDVNSGGSSTNVSLANDFYAYPQARTVILGIQAGW